MEAYSNVQNNINIPSVGLGSIIKIGNLENPFLVFSRGPIVDLYGAQITGDYLDILKGSGVPTPLSPNRITEVLHGVWGLAQIGSIVNKTIQDNVLDTEARSIKLEIWAGIIESCAKSWTKYGLMYLPHLVDSKKQVL
jgi:hypothetical protein